MKRRGQVILKFKDRKLRYGVMADRKKLMEMKDLKELNGNEELHFEESLFLSDSLCTENHNPLLKIQKNPYLLVFEHRYKCEIYG